jgi:hypothetical protein
MIVMTNNVPTKMAGMAGSHGHTYFAKTDTTFHKRSGVNPTPAANPGALKYTTDATEVNRLTTIAQERKYHKVGPGVFHTQEGAIIGLWKILIASVPNKLIVELEEKDTFFSKVTPQDLIAIVMGGTTSGLTLKSMELIKLWHAHRVFDTNKTPGLLFKQRMKHIEDLLQVHKIKTSETVWQSDSISLRRTGETLSRTRRQSGRPISPPTPSLTSRHSPPLATPPSATVTSTR